MLASARTHTPQIRRTHVCFIPGQSIRFHFRSILVKSTAETQVSRRYDPFHDLSKTLVDRVGSNPGYEKQICGQPRKPTPLDATEVSNSEKGSRATFSSYTGADSGGDPEGPNDEVAPAQRGEVPRNSQWFAAPAGDRTPHRRRHGRRRGGARHQRQRSVLLPECQTTRASKAKTGANPYPSRRNERARTHPGLEQLLGASISQRADARQVSGADSNFLAVTLTSESELDAGLARWMNEMYIEGHRAWQGERVVAGPPSIRQGRQQVHPEVSQMSQGLEEAALVVLEETTDVACVVRHGRGDDQTWTLLCSRSWSC